MGETNFKMNHREKIFADEYIRTLNGTRSAIEAGYSEKTAASTASRLLKKDNVSAYVRDRLAEAQSKKIATADEVLQFLTAVMKGEVSEQTPVKVGDGFEEIQDIMAPVSARNQAANMLAKRYGLLIDKSEITATMGVTIKDDIQDEGDDE